MKTVKLDMDDIIEILIEHYYDQFVGCVCAKGVLLGKADEDLRFVGAFGAMENDEIRDVDLIQLDKQLDYNGDHSFLKKNPEFYIKKK